MKKRGKNKRWARALTSVIDINFCPRSKRSELTTQQLVTIIILIISFAVIIFLIWRLNLGEETQKDVCHNSVVLISKGKGFVGQLDCKTNYVCISGGDECEAFSYQSKININMNSEDPGKEIIDKIQNEINDCWWMFGEGKINYVGAESIGYHCAICSVIKFDKTTQNKYTQMQFENQLDSENKILISTSEKYSIITGMDANIIGSEKYIKSRITSSEGINQLNCIKFISKA